MNDIRTVTRADERDHMTETFYGGFYGFESAPFHITPDPTLLFPTETHRAALGAIEYGISAGKGFIVVTGEVGVGKTTVLRACLDRLNASKTKIIYLFSPALTTAELYATILEEFDVMLPPTSNAADMLKVLQRTLLTFHQSGMQVVLAVDEAQQMPESTLESLRILSNLETHKSKLLQIILVGQPEFEAMLAKHSMRQLAQRVAARARIRPLSFRQSLRYVTHRTRCAGRVVLRPLFTKPALMYIALIARGIPRSINICCDNALINGYGHGAERITFRIVREACKSMKFRSPLRRVAALGAAAMVLVGLFFTGDMLLRHFYTAHADPIPVVQAPLPGVPPATAQPPPTTPPERPLAGLDARPASSANDSADATPAAAAQATPPPDTSAASASESPPAAPAPSEAPAALRPGTDNPIPAAPIPWISQGSGGGARGGSAAASKWVVRDGDSVYKACRVTYGSCDDRTLRQVIARNPNLSRDATIHPGEILLLPRHVSGSSN